MWFLLRPLFARISRVRRLAEQAPCLHGSMMRKSYDEQRERRAEGPESADAEGRVSTYKM